MTLDQARDHIGRFVIYDQPGNSKRLAEIGEITSVRNGYVFVRYDGDKNSKATYAPHLTLLACDHG
jgi:hypothetical protein